MSVAAKFATPPKAGLARAGWHDLSGVDVDHGRRTVDSDFRDFKSLGSQHRGNVGAWSLRRERVRFAGQDGQRGRDLRQPGSRLRDPGLLPNRLSAATSNGGLGECS